MLEARSDAASIIFFDRKKEGENSVLCYYEDENPQWKIGDYKILLQELKEHSKIYKKEDKQRTKIIIGMFVLLIAFVIAVGICKKSSMLGAIVFSILGYEPLLILIVAMRSKRCYKTEDAFHQFRRYHAAEHMVMQYQKKKNISWSLHEVRKCSMLSPQCGTVEAGNRLLQASIMGYAVAMAPTWGIIKMILVIVITTFVLLFLIQSRYNPLRVLQIFVVEKPTDKELSLALEGMKRFKEL